MAGKFTRPESGFDISVAREYVAECVGSDQQRNQFMTDVLEQLRNRESELNVLTLELEDQKTSRYKYQQECKEAKRQLSIYTHKLAKAAFVAVLIDGDGAKFTNAVFQNGGAKASLRLEEFIRRHLNGSDPGVFDEDSPIIVSIWANLDGLATALHKEGSIIGTSQMLRFAEEFSRSRAGFDFINVGRGKENADSKMRKMLDFYYNNLQCKKIIFAGCHDAGYVHDLQEKQGLEAAAQRIVLLKTTPAEPGFRQLTFPIINFHSVFRNAPLNNESKQFKASIQQDHTAHLVHNRTQPTIVEPFNVHRMSSYSYGGRDDPRIELSSRSNDVNDSGNGGVSITYASVGSATRPQNINISPTNARKLRSITCNEDDCRLDPPNERSWMQSAQESYNTKLESIKPKVFCNDLHLLGVCPRDPCPYGHQPNLSADEVAIQRYRARTRQCVGGPACRNYNCYLSHHCPFGTSCSKGLNCPILNTTYGNLHYDSAKERKPALRWTEGQHFPEKIG